MKQIIQKTYLKIKENINLTKILKNNILFLVYILINLINSWLLRIVTMGNLFNIKAIIADLAFIITIGAFSYLLKPNKQFKILFIFTFIMTLDCIINAIYYENYVSFASFSLLSTASFLGDMDGEVVTSLIHLKDVILIFPVIFLSIFHIILKKYNFYQKVKFNKKSFINTIIIGILMIIITFLLMTPSDYSRLKKQWNREYLVERFGIYVYQINDAIKSTESKFTSMFGYDSAAKKVREFFVDKNKEKSKNDYTNIFKGKNIIVIHAESIMTHDMTLSFNDQELTPNLNKLKNEGLFFSNYYPQISVGTSSDTEFTFNTSLLPSSTGTVFVNYWQRTYEAIPNILKQKGYYTASMHANNSSFWNRNVMHKTLGYNDFFAKDSYDYSDESTILGMGLSDEEFFRQSIDKIKKIDSENENYYLTLITLTNHTPWDDDYGDYTVDYRKKVVNEEGIEEEVVMPYMEGTELGNYFKAVHYADGALGNFINDLDNEGLLENTVVVIYGDHDARISKKEYRYFYNYDFETGELYDKEDDRYISVDYYNYELNRKVPFIIWTKNSSGNNLLNKNIDKVMGMYDAMPTLANMFDFDYKYGLGNDIFSIEENIVVFPNGNFITDKMYYNSQKEEYLLLKDSVVTEDEVNNNKEYANNILEVSDAIIVYDLEKEVENEKK